MEIDLLYDGKPLAIRAEVKGDIVIVWEGDSKVEYPYMALDQAVYVIKVGGRHRRVIAVRDGATVYVSAPGGEFVFQSAPTGDSDTFTDDHGSHGDKSKLFPPMPGKVVKVLVKEGDMVGKRQKLVIVEAMKMENPVVAPFAAEVVRVNCAEGQLVDTENVLIELKEQTQETT